MIEFESVMSRLDTCLAQQDFNEAKRIVFTECNVDDMESDDVKNLIVFLDRLSENSSITEEDFIELYNSRNFSLLTVFKNCESAYIKTNPNMLNIIGASFTATQKFNTAIDIFKEALRVMPNHEQVLNNLGVAYLEKRDFSNAETCFLNLLEINPENHDCMFNLANSYYSRNRIKSAIFYYKNYLKLQPNAITATRQICIAYLIEENYSDALKWLEKYLKFKPYDSAMISEVGNCNLMQGDIEKAQDFFKKSLEIDPLNLETQTSYGITYLKKRDYLQAIKIFNQVIESDSLNENAFFNKALAQSDLNLFDDAIMSLRLCLRVNKDNVQAENLLKELEIANERKRTSEKGNQISKTNNNNSIDLILFSEQLEKEKNYEEAIVQRLKVTEISTKDANNLFHLGRLYQELENFEEAINFYKAALEIESRLSGAVYNLAICYRALFNYRDSIEYYNQAIDLDSKNIDIYNNLALLYGEIGDIESSLETFKRGLRLNENSSVLLFNMTTPLLAIKEVEKAKNILLDLTKRTDLPDAELSNSYNSLGNVLSEQGLRRESLNAYGRALELDPSSVVAASNLIYNTAHACDWDGLEKLEKEIASVGISNGAFSPFSTWQFTPDPEIQLKRALRYTNSKHKIVSTDQVPFFQSRGKKIKIGFFSSDFRQHPVSYLIIRLLELIDRESFELTAYSFTIEHENYMRNAVINAVDKFRNVQLVNDDDLIEIVRTDAIDIAIDLTGFTDNERFLPFVRRLAPVQINFLGYPGTVANDCIDYIIADEIVIPDRFKHFYTENKIFMPNCYMPTDNLREFEKEKISRENFGLAEDAFVICCFNNNYKIGPREFDCWCRILAKFPSTVLWLKSSNELSEQNLRQEGIKRGIDPSRIIFAGFEETDAMHLGRQQLADIFVDTFNFNAHTTASEALWCGLPVISMIGETFCARVSSSLLHAVGLDDLVTKSIEEYETLICELIEDKEKLREIKSRLNNNIATCPLFDSEAYTRDFEKAMKIIYKRYQNEEQLCDVWVR